VLPAVQRLGEIPGISEDIARPVIAEIGLDMSRFPTAALMSRVDYALPPASPVPATQGGKKGQGDTWLRGCLGKERAHRQSRDLQDQPAGGDTSRHVNCLFFLLLGTPP